MRKRVGPIAIGMLGLLLTACSGPSNDPSDGTAKGEGLLSSCAGLVMSADPQQLTASEPNQIHYNILIEVTDTSSEVNQLIITAVRPFIECAVTNGSYLNVALDRGEKTELVTPPGMEGVDPIDISFNNDRRESEEKKKEIERLSGDLGSAITASTVGSFGSASRLLNYAASIKPSSEEAMEVFVLWSPLLGTSSDGTDCLDVSGIAPTLENARAVVARCTEDGLILPVSNAGVTLVGSAVGASETEQQRFATQLRDEMYQGIFDVSSGGTS